jgi:hypothetical protein
VTPARCGTAQRRSHSVKSTAHAPPTLRRAMRRGCGHRHIDLPSFLSDPLIKREVDAAISRRRSQKRQTGVTLEVSVAVPRAALVCWVSRKGPKGLRLVGSSVCGLSHAMRHSLEGHTAAQAAPECALRKGPDVEAQFLNNISAAFRSEKHARRNEPPTAYQTDNKPSHAARTMAAS